MVPTKEFAFHIEVASWSMQMDWCHEVKSNTQRQEIDVGN